MLKDLGDLEKQRVDTRNTYLKKMEKVLSPAKTLRFAQVESRLDLALRMGLAAQIPLVPIEGRMTGQAALPPSRGGCSRGKRGANDQMTATVAAIDQASRKVTLMRRTGSSRR